MIDAAELESAYDAAFAAHAPRGLRVRPEAATDEAFLRELFLSTYPLRDVLPAPLLAQQADLRIAAFRDGVPGAMRRIVEDAGGPVGRIVVDWNAPEGSLCVDIAVRPAAGGRGLGTALLRAWIDVAAGRGLGCTLTVEPDNPARALYARLGFQEAPDSMGAALIAMARPAFLPAAAGDRPK